MNGRLTPETDALARAWRDWDDSEAAEQPKSFRELSWELEQQRDEARQLALELQDALLAREELNQVGLLFADENLLRRVDDTHRKAIAKAKEVLP
jgi:inactivated superfamily I helicase